ncbi:hypothetical protein PGTUg99_023225 [Puccinia graminis f. sp. tritici]|uniref:Uncharacterized protein n=1 Tax=Puccinia graminis f. sp. tritici TaxID=56615 RepID=A0A5B0RUL3_PUCGR|nr:hypothetical protein PGTUg99_023225 [Puccinia graminis f. sp. tritici]
MSLVLSCVGEKELPSWGLELRSWLTSNLEFLIYWVSRRRSQAYHVFSTIFQAICTGPVVYNPTVLLSPQFLPLDQPPDFSDSNPLVSTIFPTIFSAISPNSPTTRALVLYVYPPVSTILLPHLDCPPIGRYPRQSSRRSSQTRRLVYYGILVLDVWLDARNPPFQLCTSSNRPGIYLLSSYQPINRLSIIHPAIGLSIGDLPDYLPATILPLFPTITKRKPADPVDKGIQSEQIHSYAVFASSSGVNGVPWKKEGSSATSSLDILQYLKSSSLGKNPVACCNASS